METREERDAGALIRQRMQEKQEEGARETGPAGTEPEAAAAAVPGDAKAPMEAPAAEEKPAAGGAAEPAEEINPAAEEKTAEETEPAAPTKRELRARERQERAAGKKEKREAALRLRQARQEERRLQKRERREQREQARAERRQEIRSLTGLAGFVLLAVFALLAIDQAGLYGFLFVWLFFGVAAVSAALLFLGIFRAVRRKRCGIVFFLSLLGMLVTAVWAAFLSSSWGLGLGPVFFFMTGF
ncbi:MAG TPA: hypothetical protein H9763_09555 [Candidatus Eisenbergiella merdigallinarum]|uniref:Uncharacterized protein n=1 Tax=Candidatus Eisenbergiella merdigallinarum TaxID=2838552 RepID=A0A9D2MU44_9FIRM|nr:hypothetical protein [Candidatus Eisenbergiella merdigallinarum]